MTTRKPLKPAGPKELTAPKLKSQPARVSPEGQFRIAAVSKLTGMLVPTLRMWERRYAVVSPVRSEGNGRLYSRADIDRLILLKSATDAGHAIGTVAKLSEAELRARLLAAPARRAAALAEHCRVLVCGSAMSTRLKTGWAERSDIEVCATLVSLSSADVVNATTADAVIIELPTLQISSLRVLRKLRTQARARVMIVVYGFSNRQALTRLDQEGIIALALPAEAAHLARICHLGLAMQAPRIEAVELQLMQPAVARRYDADFLATVAHLPTTMRCECPNHLADLLAKLNAFEQYSLECESADAADASIHSLLFTAAAQCRSLLEHALHRVLEHEGIADPTAVGAAKKITPLKPRPAFSR